MSYNPKPISNNPLLIIENPWVKRARDRRKLVDDYVSNFKNISPSFAEAEREGWALNLWRYVYAMADLQAQMIVGEKNIGWSSVDIFGAGVLLEKKTIHAFLNDQKRRSQTGVIDVPIPTTRLNEWKQAVQKRKEEVAPQVAKTEETSPVAVKTALDLEIDRQLLLQGEFLQKKIEPVLDF